MRISWRRRLRNQSLLGRVWLGNAIIILVGAVLGTLLTRYLTMAGNLGLILLFSVLGILLSLLINYVIVRLALRPLRELCQLVERIETGKLRVPQALLQDVDPDIRRLAAAINSMLGRLERRTLQLRALSERAINVQEEERRRIARGLHDDTAQALSMLIINLERLERLLPAGSTALLDQVAAARRLATGTLDDLRKIVFELRPTMLDDLGLVPAIRWYVRFALANEKIEIRFDTPDESVRLRSSLETTLFRIAQEAVNNVLHHAKASVVVIGMWPDETGIFLQVEDDGCGFDVDATTGQAVVQNRLGLLGMQERVSLVGGRLTVTSAPDAGTVVKVWVPV